MSANQLAKETGLKQQTLSHWLREARNVPDVASTRRVKARPVAEKVRLLNEASELEGDQLTDFLERESVSLGEIERWRLALDEDGGESKAVARRIRSLERELARKEKALAEAAALLVLKKKWRAVGGRGRRHGRAERDALLAAISEAQAAGARMKEACKMAGISARTIQRWRTGPGEDQRCGPHHRPENALTPLEEARLVAVMTSGEFGGLSPKQIVPRLADRGLYLASESTMYRLRRRLELQSRRPAQSRTNITRASLVHRASRPNQVWSWDITYLPSLVRGRFFFLYLILDVWSRRIVAAEVYEREGSDLAAALVARACDESGVDPKGLILHSDNGKPMRGATVISTLQWLGVVPSSSRPHVCNDNPYSEALFRTLKHAPAYPATPFADLTSARTWVARFVRWYNTTHRHSGIRYVTPDERHFGGEAELLVKRRAVYERARRRKPERWTGPTRNWTPVGEVILNPEPTTKESQAA